MKCKSLQGIALTVLASLLLAGCSQLRIASAPPTLRPSGYKVGTSDNDEGSFRKDLAEYHGDIKSGKLDDARAKRDEIINRILVDVEANFKTYEAQLFSRRATAETVADSIESGVSAATTVVGGADVKSLLAAGLSGFKGARGSFDSNFFRDKSTEIIAIKMEAARTEIKNQIVQKTSNLDALHYPFEEAWVDLIDFYYAGTLEGGLVALAADAGSSASKAKLDTQIGIDLRTLPDGITPDDIRFMVDLHKKIQSLKLSNNVAAARKILQDANIAAPSDDAMVFDALLAALRAAIGDPAQTSKLLRAAGIIK